MFRYLKGHVLEQLGHIPSDTPHCVVTSPPYWGLRRYPIPDVVWPDGWVGQLGLEPTPELYISHMVLVFAEVRRVLRPDGTCWLNIGDSYCTKPHGAGSTHDPKWPMARARREGLRANRTNAPGMIGLKHKDALLIPWRLGLALQADGWYVRCDIIWHKPNPMPESVEDRPTKAHEYLLLLTKGQTSQRSIKFTDLEPQCVHFGKNFGFEPSHLGASNLCVQLATAIFESAQRQHNFGLPPFYSEEWKETFDRSSRVAVGDLPAVKIAAAHAARFLNASTTTKEFLCELNGFVCNLRESNLLLVGKGLPFSFHSPTVLVNSDATIAVNDSGEIRKVDLIHGEIIDTVHTGCKYFYDAEAIKEPVSGTAHARGDGLNPKVEGVNSRMNKSRVPRDYDDKPNFSIGSLRPRQNADFSASVNRLVTTRNKRSVWTITSEAFKDAHFATFPKALVAPCVMAGTSARGCCALCGAPWERVLERTETPKDSYNGKYQGEDNRGANLQRALIAARAAGGDHDNPFPPKKTIGWQPTCECNGKLKWETVIIPARISKEDAAAWGADSKGEYNGQSVKCHPSGVQNSSTVKKRIIDNATKDRKGKAWVYHPDIPLEQHPVVPCTVLDPFVGSGTVPEVALELGRHAIGIDLSDEYEPFIKQRTTTTPGLPLA